MVRNATTLSFTELSPMFPEFDSIRYDSQPFEHFSGRCKLTSSCDEWLAWLETDAPWKLTETDFYEQYEFSLLQAPLAGAVARLACPETLQALRLRMARQFGQPLSERVDVTAHKLVAGQTIRIHNDYLPEGESQRLLLQLNRGWKPEYGGYLMFFGGPDPETVSKVVEPMHGSVQAFAVSPGSYHAVSTVHRGERYTVVYSFYPASSQPHAERGHEQEAAPRPNRTP